MTPQRTTRPRVSLTALKAQGFARNFLPIRGSSVLAGVEYKARTLRILFHSGRVKAYGNIPATTSQNFMDAPSKGGFYNRELKGQR